MRRPRLVATDVDGTVLGPGDVPSARTRAVVARMTAAGVPLVLATGRPPRWVPSVCAALDVHGLVVAANGAVLYDAGSDTVLEVAALDVAAVTEVVAALRDTLPEGGLAVERVRVGDGADRREQFVSEPAYVHAWPGSDHDEVDAAELVAEPAVKILARQVGRPSDELATVVAARVGHLVEVTFSASTGLVECSARGVSKAHGLAAAAARHGVDAADVVAFGDMPNDREMLAWAGHGVGMGNAHPVLRDEADEVTANHLDDGVALVLERWF